MQQLYLCRHGQTEWTLQGRHTGTTDIPLTKEGKKQAETLQKHLKFVRFEKIFTSPKQRARSTCEGLAAIVEPLAVEWDYGDYEGITTEQIHQKNAHWNLFTDGAPNGESPEEIGARADLLLEKLSRYQGNIALFSHGHFLRVLAARFLGLNVADAQLFALSVASMSILGWERNVPVIVLWNSTFSKDGDDPTHLKG